MGIVKKKNKYLLSNLLCGLQQAVNEACEIQKAKQMENLRRYWDADGKLLTEKINTGQSGAIEVPLLTLIPQNALIMDKVEVEFDAEPESAVEGIQKSHLKGTDMLYEVMELNMGSIKEKNLMHIKVCFKAAQTPEGICKVIDECNKTF